MLKIGIWEKTFPKSSFLEFLGYNRFPKVGIGYWSYAGYLVLISYKRTVEIKNQNFPKKINKKFNLKRALCVTLKLQQSLKFKESRTKSAKGIG